LDEDLNKAYKKFNSAPDEAKDIQIKKTVPEYFL